MPGVNAPVPVAPLVGMPPPQLPQATQEEALLLDQEMVEPELFHANEPGLVLIETLVAGQESFEGVLPFGALQLPLHWMVPVPPGLVWPHALGEEGWP